MGNGSSASASSASPPSPAPAASPGGALYHAPLPEGAWLRVAAAIRHLEGAGAASTEGIYRVSGLATDVRRGVAFLAGGGALRADELGLPEWAASIKGCLRQHEPLTSYRLFDALSDASPPQLPSILSALPREWYQRLRVTCKHLVGIAAHSRANLMTASNLAKIWGGVLARRDEAGATDIRAELQAAARQYKIACALLEFFSTPAHDVQQLQRSFHLGAARADASGRAAAQQLPPPLPQPGGGGGSATPAAGQAMRRQLSAESISQHAAALNHSLRSLAHTRGRSTTDTRRFDGGAGRAFGGGGAAVPGVGQAATDAQLAGALPDDDEGGPEEEGEGEEAEQRLEEAAARRRDDDDATTRALGSASSAPYAGRGGGGGAGGDEVEFTARRSSMAVRFDAAALQQSLSALDGDDGARGWRLGGGDERPPSLSGSGDDVTSGAPSAAQPARAAASSVGLWQGGGGDGAAPVTGEHGLGLGPVNGV